MRTSCAIRVDASRLIGLGHSMRCLTLADALRAAGVRTTFVSRHMPDFMVARIQERGHRCVLLPAPVEPIHDDRMYTRWLGVSQRRDAEETIAALGSDRFDWLIVDHYALDREWHAIARAGAAHIMAIDDLADRVHDCDLLLDQNIDDGTQSRYLGKIPPGARVLLGPRFALLRDEFRIARKGMQPRTGEVRRILVFFGGIDGDDYTSVALEGLIELRQSGLAVDVVIGDAHPNRLHIQSLCNVHGFDLHVQCEQMADLMAKADLAIGAGGSATWERCCVGLPSLVVAVAENQQALLRSAATAGLIWAPSISKDPSAFALHTKALHGNPLWLRTMSARAMEVIDGRGTERVIRAMGIEEVLVRPATKEDCAHLFEWRNHSSVRHASRSQEPIEWKNHAAWVEAVLADPQRVLLIAEIHGTPVGVVRFDVVGSSAEVSIYKVPEASTGSGADILAAAESWLLRRRPEIRELVAEVLGKNLPSHRLFARAGYVVSTTRYAKRID